MRFPVLDFGLVHSGSEPFIYTSSMLSDLYNNVKHALQQPNLFLLHIPTVGKSLRSHALISGQSLAPISE